MYKRQPVSAVLGALAAWLNFFGLAMTLQKVTAAAEEARGRSLMRTSELYRKLGLGLFRAVPGTILAAANHRLARLAVFLLSLIHI